MARLVVPPRSTLETMVAVPRQVVTAVRVYRRTPQRLRRTEPAARLGVAIASVWFAVLYVSLAVSSYRAPSSTALITMGYAAAAALGPIGCALFLSRRPRAGLTVLGGMLVVGQAVAVASMMVA